VPSSTYIHLRQTLSSLYIREELRSVLLQLFTLSNTLSGLLSTPDPCSHTKQEQILDQTYLIQYVLLRPWREGEPRCESDTLEECFRVAGLLYLHATWQDFPFSALRVTKLLSRLKDVINDISLREEASINVLIWLLFV
jgi:hypothetical protein